MSKRYKTVKLMRRQGTVIQFSDYAYVRYSYQGITVHFANFVPADDSKDGEGIAEESAVIGMSPEQTKALYDLIGKQLELYEKEFGAIRTLALEQEDEAKPGEDSE